MSAAVYECGPVWTDTYKHNWDDAYKRVMRWWRNEETDRPVIFNAVPKPEHPAKLPPEHPAKLPTERPAKLPLEAERSGAWIRPKDAAEAEKFDLDADVQLNNARCGLENTLFLAESAPTAHSKYASLLGLQCVQAGGRVGYAMDTGTAWLMQEENLFDRPLPEVSRPCRQLDFILDMIGRNHGAFGFDVILGANPMIDPLSTLSMMLGSDEFCLSLIDRPEDVKRWAGRLGELYRKAVEGWRTARAAFGRREDFNWTGAWAPGDMDTLESDVSVMLSPEMFRDFALPEAEYEASFFDYTLWHLDGSGQFKHLDDILAIPNLHGIQYVDEKRRDPIIFADVWEKILRKGKSIIFSCDYHYAPALTKRLGKRGLAFGAWGCNSEADMEWLINGVSGR
jgi:hypothetical protein